MWELFLPHPVFVGTCSELDRVQKVRIIRNTQYTHMDTMQIFIMLRHVVHIVTIMLQSNRFVSCSLTLLTPPLLSCCSLTTLFLLLMFITSPICRFEAAFVSTWLCFQFIVSFILLPINLFALPHFPHRWKPNYYWVSRCGPFATSKHPITDTVRPARAIDSRNVNM
jgi:hypothetical protein